MRSWCLQGLSSSSKNLTYQRNCVPRSSVHWNLTSSIWDRCVWSLVPPSSHWLHPSGGLHPPRRGPVGCRRLALGVLVLLPSTGVLAFLPFLLGAQLGEKSQPVLLGRKCSLHRGETSGHPVELQGCPTTLVWLISWSWGFPQLCHQQHHPQFVASGGVPRSTFLSGPGCDHSGLHLDSLWGSGLGALVLCLDWTLPICAEGQGPVPSLCLGGRGTNTWSFPIRLGCTPMSRPPESSLFLPY